MGGEAKKRGTFEERKAQAVVRKQEEEEKRRQEWLAKEASMTAEEKTERAKTQHSIAYASSMWIGAMYGAMR
jgi:hypothetical protein